MDFWRDPNVEDDLKSQVSFQIVNAIREAVTTALKLPQPITYEKALSYLEDVSPTTHEIVTSLLPNKNESDLIKYFKDVAKASSTSDNVVNPQDLISEEIKKHEEILKNSHSDHRHITGHIKKLRSAENYFKDRSLSEHKILAHDFYLASRNKLKPLNTTAEYRDYQIDDDRKLRINLLHPDNNESILGADLIYEQYDFKYNLVRFVHLQYKTWNSKVLYLNDERLSKQLQRLQNHNCTAGYCKSGGNDNDLENFDFRYPYCSAFLRPTNKVVKENSKMVSTGIHIPICKVARLKNIDGQLNKQNTRDVAISQSIFEELFNNCHVGSRWMPFGELIEYYEKRKLYELENNVRIHAQEVINTFAEDEEF